MSEYIILIAELNNIIIGYLVGELSKENFHILSFGVDNLHRNKGIGAVIIKKLIDWGEKYIVFFDYGTGICITLNNKIFTILYYLLQVVLT